jgi:VCBS repeat-containing protein
VITSGHQVATIIEPGDLAFIHEAGPNHPSDGGRPGLEPTVDVDAVLTGEITAGISVAAMNTALDAVQAALGTGATRGDAIAAVWNYLDTRYYYTNDVVNEAQAKLAIVYAQYLQGGGMALLDVVAKYTPDGNDAGDTPDRVQSLHDNILGNLGWYGLADKLGAGSAAYLRIEAAASDAGLSALFHDRPVYSGDENATDLSLAWDIGHGLYPAASGTMTASDVDTPASGLSWSDVTGSAGIYGAFAIDATSGKWTYVLNPGAADSLAAGDTRVETFTVQVSDGHGGIDTATVSITIVGSNDAPVISIDASETTATIGGELAVTRSLTETDAGLQTTGTLTVSDVDAGDTASVRVLSVSGGGGGYNPSAQGALAFMHASLNGGTLTWSFDSGSETFDFLPKGFQTRLTYLLEVSDNHGATNQQTISILITGTNDAPVITSGGYTGSVVESGGSPGLSMRS